MCVQVERLAEHLHDQRVAHLRIDALHQLRKLSIFERTVAILVGKLKEALKGTVLDLVDGFALVGHRLQESVVLHSKHGSPHTAITAAATTRSCRACAPIACSADTALFGGYTCGRLLPPSDLH